MNRSIGFLFAIVCSVGLIPILTNDIAYAQPTSQYTVEYMIPPNGVTFIQANQFAKIDDGINTAIIAVGKFRSTEYESSQGFIYDHRTGEFTDVRALLQIGDEWPGSSCLGIGSTGIVVGVVSNSDGSYHKPIWFDLLAANPTLNFLEDVFPELNQPYPIIATNVNGLGDILVDAINGDQPDMLANPFTGELITLNGFQATAVNDQRIVVGGTSLYYGEPVRYDSNSGQMEVFSQYGSSYSYAEDINNSNQFCGSGVQVRKRTKPFAYRHGAEGNASPAEWSSEPFEVISANRLNEQGDVLGSARDDDRYFLFHSESNQVLRPDQLISDQFFLSGTTFHSADLLDRTSATALPTIAGNIQGLNGEYRLFFMIEESQDPTPGILVNPVNGLITDESGGPDSFDIVLDTQPTADVTIDISTSDSTEGMIDDPNLGLVEVTSLTFTTANWDTPQTITVTGVDDDLEFPPNPADGDQAYTIITAAATSADDDYNGLDADDVSVTNEDNDGPGGGSETYDATDIPQDGLEIPDNDPSGIDPPSTIFVDDHMITNLTVSLDISHQRSSDLEVYLYGPVANDPPVQLFNFSGDNNVVHFNGTVSSGTWTIEVIDTRKKKTGTLNGWSITVDY